MEIKARAVEDAREERRGGLRGEGRERTIQTNPRKETDTRTVDVHAEVCGVLKTPKEESQEKEEQCKKLRANSGGC